MQQPFPAYRGDDPYVFVSYSHEDATLVYQEVARLHGAGFNIWYDEGIAPGQTWRDEVADALARCEVFLYFVTPRSVSSPNCRKEVNFCLARNRKLLSVHLEATHLPAGLELSLSDMQGIIRGDYPAEEYELKLTAALRSLLGDTESSSPVATRPQPRVDSQSIAILPLVNRSSDPDNDHLCNGIAEELIGGLASLAGLKVASPLSSFALKNQGMDVELIGQKLDVEHVLSGSVQKSGNRVRVRVLLSRVKDGSSLWSARYDRELEVLAAGADRMRVGVGFHRTMLDRMPVRFQRPAARGGVRWVPGVSASTKQWGWLALAMGALSLASLALWALPGRPPPRTQG